jgi:hypothetical protein
MAADALWRGEIRDALRLYLLAWQCNAVVELDDDERPEIVLSDERLTSTKWHEALTKAMVQIGLPHVDMAERERADVLVPVDVVDYTKYAPGIALRGDPLVCCPRCQKTGEAWEWNTRNAEYPVRIHVATFTPRGRLRPTAWCGVWKEEAKQARKDAW